MQNALNTRDLSPGHGRAILSLVNPSDMRILFRRITEKGISVREAEAMAADLNKGHHGTKTAKAKKTSGPKQPELYDMEKKLLDRFGTKVRITGNGKKGTIEIAYLSMDDLDRVYEILTGKA